MVPARGMRHGVAMTKFELPSDLFFNTGKIVDPARYAKKTGAASWLYLNGEEFASMDGGMSYAQVREAVARSTNVISDPPRMLDLSLAERHVAALDDLPRPTLVSCRSGPRSSAVVYMYAGLRAGAEPSEVIEAAKAASAPVTAVPENVAWVIDSMTALRKAGGR